CQQESLQTNALATAIPSTITLTMDRYAHTIVEEQSAAIAVLLDLFSARRLARSAKGTDVAKLGHQNLASSLALLGRFEETSVDCGVLKTRSSDIGTSVA